MRQKIEKKLMENLQPKFLQVENKSHLHRGHLGDDGSGETHFAIIIAADSLENLSHVQAHRKINKLLKVEFENGLHALEIRVK